MAPEVRIQRFTQGKGEIATLLSHFISLTHDRLIEEGKVKCYEEMEPLTVRLCNEVVLPAGTEVSILTGILSSEIGHCQFEPDTKSLPPSCYTSI